MRIIRYEDPSGRIHYAAQEQGDSYLRVEGELFDGFGVTSEPAAIRRILAPVIPVMIWCIGQNYRRHADEVGMVVAEYPVVFAKGTNTIQDPEVAIQLPTGAGSSQVDYEGDRKSTRLNSSHSQISYAVFCLKKKKTSVDIHFSVSY